MKLTASVSAILFSVSLSAAAQVTVDQMTCEQAQAYSAKHGRYYKNGGVDGPIPIYPTYTLDKINCTGKTLVSAQTERTLDVADCILSWYCRSY